MATEGDLLEALRAQKFVTGNHGLRFLFDVINAATADDLDLILPIESIGVTGDISAAFAVDYGTPSHRRRILRDRARRAIRLNKGNEIRIEWMRRLAARATTAMLAGRQMPATTRRGTK